MLRDGLYKIVYRANAQPEVEFDELAVARDGRLLAPDSNGGIYQGASVLDSHSGSMRIDMTAEVPPGGELVTGFAGGPEGAAASLVAYLDSAALSQRSVIHIEGAPLDVEIFYLGPCRIEPIAASRCDG